MRAMDADRLFLLADGALRDVIDRLTPEHLARRAPDDWGHADEPTFHDVVVTHSYDEAWVPDVLAGKAMADGDPWRDHDLAGDDVVAAYDAFHDAATAAVRAGSWSPVFRFQYGDYPAAEGFAHLSSYRAFQAWLVAKHLGIPFHLSPELLDGLDEHVVVHADEWRQWGVFPPAIEPPADADHETRVLCAVGHWTP